jgi:Ulp1 family protease
LLLKEMRECTAAQVHPREMIPQQRDGSSCGVFMLVYAELRAMGVRMPFSFSQDDMPRIRRAVVGQLLRDLPPP